MFSFKAVKNKIGAFVGNISGATGAGESLTRRCSVFLSITVLAALLSRPTVAKTLPEATQDIEETTDQLSTTTNQLQAHTSSLINKYFLTNAGKCAIMIAGLSSNGILSISFIPGPTAIAGLQADVLTDVPLTMVMAGTAASAAGKTVSSSAVSGGRRFLLVGFNQTALGVGEAVMIHYDDSQSASGDHPVALTNFSATDPNGRTVPICVTSGVITK